MTNFTGILAAIFFVFVSLVGLTNAAEITAKSTQANVVDKRTYLFLGPSNGRLNKDVYSENIIDRGQSKEGFSLTFGGRMSKRWGGEFSLSNLGTYRIEDSRLNRTERIALRSFSVDLHTYLYESGGSPIGPGIPGVSVFLKTGVSKCYQNDRSYHIQLCDGYYFNLGLGTDIHLHRNFAIRLQAQAMNNDIYTASAGFRFRGAFVEVLGEILSAFVVYR